MIREPITVLAIDDDPADAEILRRSLNELPEFEAEFVHVADPDLVGEELSRRDVDIAFLDYRLGRRTGLEVLRAIRAAGHMPAIIALTGRGDEYAAADLVRGGADEYLVKRDLSPAVLRNSIENAKARHSQRVAEHDASERTQRLIQEMAEANVELARLNRYDPLTQLLNRRAWEEFISLENERSMRYGHTYSVIMIDLDHFKLLNDSCGHQAGDDCLREVGRCIAATCRRTDMAGRYGGEEFIVLAPETEAEGAQIFAERIRTTIEGRRLAHRTSPLGGRIVTASLGISAGPSGEWQNVIKQADEALYMAKRQGRNRVVVRPHD